jgi:hypothetical protein
METRDFDFDPISGTRTLFHYDHADDAFTLETINDYTDIVEAAKAQYNSTDERAGWKGELHHVMRIPLEYYFAWKKEGILHDQKELAKRINSPELRAFRVRPGVV